MRKTDLQLCLAGARRWRQGVLDLRLSLAPVKEPLNCSTVELCPPHIAQGSADFTFSRPAQWFLRLLLEFVGFSASTRKPGAAFVNEITNGRLARQVLLVW